MSHANTFESLFSEGPPTPPPFPDPLTQALRAPGWVDGQNVVFESRFDGGKREPLPSLAAELVDRAQGNS